MRFTALELLFFLGQTVPTVSSHRSLTLCCLWFFFGLLPTQRFLCVCVSCGNEWIEFLLSGHSHYHDLAAWISVKVQACVARCNLLLVRVYLLGLKGTLLAILASAGGRVFCLKRYKSGSFAIRGRVVMDCMCQGMDWVWGATSCQFGDMISLACASVHFKGLGFSGLSQVEDGC